MLSSAVPLAVDVYQDFADGSFTAGNQSATVAEELARGGPPGERVAVIGNGFEAYWARLAGLRIVAELPRDQVAAFRAADTETRARVLAAFARSGASAIVTDEQLPDADGWRRLGDTGYRVRLLDRSARPPGDEPPSESRSPSIARP